MSAAARTYPHLSLGSVLWCPVPQLLKNGAPLRLRAPIARLRRSSPQSTSGVSIVAKNPQYHAPLLQRAGRHRDPRLSFRCQHLSGRLRPRAGEGFKVDIRELWQGTEPTREGATGQVAPGTVLPMARFTNQALRGSGRALRAIWVADNHIYGLIRGLGGGSVPRRGRSPRGERLIGKKTLGNAHICGLACPAMEWWLLW